MNLLKCSVSGYLILEELKFDYSLYYNGVTPY